MSFLRVLFGGKKTPEEKERMMFSLKKARFEIAKRINLKLPEHLRISDGNPTELIRAIVEQINYATASSKFVGDDKEMLRKLEVLVAELRLNGAGEAASELISTMKMRPNYLALAERIMR